MAYAHKHTELEVDVGYRERPHINLALIAAKTKPTIVNVGIWQGFSLPVSNGSDDEVVHLIHSVPRRWNGESDIAYSVTAILDTANTDKKFKMRIDWEHFSEGDILPATTHAATYEVSTGTASQYASFQCPFTIDYDIDGGGNEIQAGELLGIKLYRIAASSDEITGEVIVFGGWLNYRRDKIGVQWT